MFRRLGLELCLLLELAMATWIFQANPDQFHVEGYLSGASRIRWTIRQTHFKDSIAPGDTVYIWRAGGRSKSVPGIIALTRVSSRPAMMADDERAVPLWIEHRPTEELRVELDVVDGFQSGRVLEAREIKTDSRLADLAILKFRSHTNYPVTTDQSIALAELWSSVQSRESVAVVRDWSDSENAAIVSAYFDMMDQHRIGSPYVKSKVSEELRAGPLAARNRGSVEFKMRDVSSALRRNGLPWLPGYYPTATPQKSLEERVLFEASKRWPLDTLSTGDDELRQRRVKIAAGHVDLAMQDLDSDPPYGPPRSTDYDVLHKGQLYPPIELVRLAAQHATLTPLRGRIRGGDGTQCFTILRNLGFDIVSKGHLRDDFSQGIEREAASVLAEPTPDIEGLVDARRKVQREIAVRQGQPEFRRALLDAYRGTCAMTGCSVEEAVEAAHILPYMGEQTNTVTNGLLLRGDIHTLFDRGLVSVDELTMEIIVSPKLRQTQYGELDGKRLLVPTNESHRPAKKCLRHHRDFAGL